jgi:hypothetical protein
MKLRKPQRYAKMDQTNAAFSFALPLSSVILEWSWITSEQKIFKKFLNRILNYKSVFIIKVQLLLLIMSLKSDMKSYHVEFSYLKKHQSLRILHRLLKKFQIFKKY